ncbi:hypothetical protein BJX63DRAFT_224720 [Aspergillus granulosus]|uniref:Xylanolytic transcriptional activator regulatory domain-containing protein n=1 Tax=Aspergillus granulosus TaxID=176169 RepID=A0ABR4HDJ8_9EURO
MSQALELHSSHVIETERAKGSQREIHLFWAVYALEKAVSLRLGRPSTIKDQDITVPRLDLDRTMTSLVYYWFPDWITLASLYGRMYDNLYSPNALAQPASIRASRIKVLASELERMMALRAEYYKRPNHLIQPSLSRFIIHANKAIEYSTLASIYRGSPEENPSGLVPCLQCITAARLSLKESESCIVILLDTETWPRTFDSWINEILLLAPFMPFLILLCNVVETCDTSDLARLQRLIDGLHSLAQSPRYTSCNKQLRIFKAMYDVGAKYVQAKEQRQPEDVIGQSTYVDMDTHLGDNTWLDTASYSTSLYPVSNTQPLDIAQKQMAASSDGIMEYQENTLVLLPSLPDDHSTDIDTSAFQLGSWTQQAY